MPERHLTEEHKQKISEANKGKKRSEETRKKIGEASKGRCHSEEWKKRMSERLKGNQIMIGRYLSEETKKKISEANQGKHSIPFSEEHKKKLSEAKTGKYIGMDSPHWKGGDVKIICKVCDKERYVRLSIAESGRAKFCSRRCVGIWSIKHMKTKDTSIELLVEQELIKRGIHYLKQAPIEGIALVDFLLPNKIIIQADGDYWHSSERNKGKDAIQDAALFSKDYKVFRFWEKDIKKSVEKCINNIVAIRS